MKSAISFLAVASLVSAMTAFQFKTGQCPEVDEMKHFDMNRVRIRSIFRPFDFVNVIRLLGSF